MQYSRWPGKRSFSPLDFISFRTGRGTNQLQRVLLDRRKQVAALTGKITQHCLMPRVKHLGMKHETGLVYHLVNLDRLNSIV